MSYTFNADDWCGRSDTNAEIARMKFTRGHDSREVVASPLTSIGHQHGALAQGDASIVTAAGQSTNSPTPSSVARHHAEHIVALPHTNWPDVLKPK